METKINVNDFFKDSEFAKKVKLTQEEAKILRNFESDYEEHNGFSCISGGFAYIILEELDEENDNIVIGYMKSGIQNDCENVVYTDPILFNRATKVVTFR